MNTLTILLKGLLMGAADIIPGVSGGTIAFITGIYDRFIKALSDLSTVGKLFLQGKWKKGWNIIDFEFLIPLTIGITIAFILGSFVITSLIDSYPTYVFSFFIGLILVSAYVVYTHIKEHNIGVALTGIIGILLGFFVASSPSFSTRGSLLFVFISGIVSISAMLLPGISGSYVLLVLGQYEYILESLQQLNWPVLISFKLGAITGLLVFSRILSWLLKKYHSMTFSALTGIMIGALYRPWQDALEFATPEMIPASVFFLVLGAVIVIILERTHHKTTT